MTSGVYPRKPGNGAGRRPILSDAQVERCIAFRAKGYKTKFLAAQFYVCVLTLQRAIRRFKAKELK